MKTNNITLINMYYTLMNCSTYKLPQKIGYAIMKNLKILQPDVDIYNKAYAKLEDKYVDKIQKDKDNQIKRSENGSPIFVTTKDAEVFLKEYSELANIEIEVDLYQIDEELFNYDDSNGRYDTLAPKDIMTLQTILCKQSEEKEEK